MRIPKQVKVAGHAYKVEFPFLFKEGPAGGLSLLGQKEIKLADVDKAGVKYPNVMILNTLLHEILHCIDWEYNGSTLNEGETERIANGLYQVLRDNKLHFDE